MNQTTASDYCSGHNPKKDHRTSAGTETAHSFSAHHNLDLPGFSLCLTFSVVLSSKVFLLNFCSTQALYVLSEQENKCSFTCLHRT